MKDALFFTTVSANCLLYLLGTTSNVVMGYLFFRRKRLQTRINSFIAHLSVNSAVRSFVVYSKIVNSLIGEKYLNSSICNLIAIIEVSTSAQFFSLIAALSYSILKSMICDRQFALIVTDDLAILQHVVIFFASLTLAAFGLDSFDFEESRSTCGVKYNPGYSIFQIFLLGFKFLVGIFIFYVYCRVCKSDLRNRKLIHPIGVESKCQQDSTAASDTSHDVTCSPIVGGQIDSATGVCSNGNTKSTELDSSNTSPCDSAHCDIGEPAYDEKQSFGSAKSNSVQSNVLFVHTAKTDDDDLCFGNLDSPNPSTARPKLHSVKYRDPNSFDSDNDSQNSLKGQIVVFSALPGAGMEGASVRETSFCLEVEDLRTGKTFRTNDINQVPTSSSASRTCNSKVSEKPNFLCAQHLKKCEPDDEFHESEGIESVFGTTDCKLESHTSKPEFIDDKEAAQVQRERNAFWRFTRSVVLVLRRYIVRTKKHSNKVAAVQACYEQNECNLDEEDPGSLSLKSFDSGQYGRDVVACDFELRTRCGNEILRTNSTVASRPVVSQSIDEKMTQKDRHRSCCDENNTTSITEYVSNSKQYDLSRDLHSTQYIVAPCNGCHGAGGVLRRNSAEEQRKTTEERRSMVIFMISCLSIVLTTPILSLEFLAVVGVWTGAKVIVTIADLVSDLTISLVPIVYAYACLDFRQELFSLFIKKS